MTHFWPPASNLLYHALPLGRGGSKLSACRLSAHSDLVKRKNYAQSESNHVVFQSLLCSSMLRLLEDAGHDLELVLSAAGRFCDP